MDTLRAGYSGPALSTLLAQLSAQGFWPEHKSVESFSAAVEGAVCDFQASALGPDKAPLVVDGVVGNKTWWALAHYRGDDQRLWLPDDRIPAGLTELRAKVLGEYLALADARCQEKPLGSNRGPLVDGLLPDWWMAKHGLARPLVKGPAWCMFTYSRCYHRAAGQWHMGRNHGSCWKASKDAAKRGLWVPWSEGVTPVPGDCGLILRPNGTGHAMVVYRVSEDGTRINTVEGNIANRVGVRVRDCKDLAGFIRADDHLCEGFERGLLEAKTAHGEGTR